MTLSTAAGREALLLASKLKSWRVKSWAPEAGSGDGDPPPAISSIAYHEAL